MKHLCVVYISICLIYLLNFFTKNLIIFLLVIERKRKYTPQANDVVIAHANKNAPEYNKQFPILFFECVINSQIVSFPMHAPWHGISGDDNRRSRLKVSRIIFLAFIILFARAFNAMQAQTKWKNCQYGCIRTHNIPACVYGCIFQRLRRRTEWRRMCANITET